MESEAVLIANKRLDEEKRKILNEMLFRIDAVRNAEDKKYVRMNAPKARLDEIISVLPGLKSPTVIPLADEEWCSVHTVLDEKRFWEIIEGWNFSLFVKAYFHWSMLSCFPFLFFAYILGTVSFAPSNLTFIQIDGICPSSSSINITARAHDQQA